MCAQARPFGIHQAISGYRAGYSKHHLRVMDAVQICSILLSNGAICCFVIWVSVLLSNFRQNHILRVCTSESH
jgi:hypothetical protein